MIELKKLTLLLLNILGLSTHRTSWYFFCFLTCLSLRRCHCYIDTHVLPLVHISLSFSSHNLSQIHTPHQSEPFNFPSSTYLQHWHITAVSVISELFIGLFTVGWGLHTCELQCPLKIPVPACSELCLAISSVYIFKFFRAYVLFLI